ncbi:hypothetical protein E4T81_12160 [Barnesiella sp. WM24]|uniref:hypothetical protein n=1 Tax=Barnesiella sp. WM24 TaxID=2558278 RepID=UPI0010715F75|nr:hypothetical protein [Barnesiella sp. WM24]TFU92337.1 hypothetical protein E4T81_12160 [Barnesiella sp. WM24]
MEKRYGASGPQNGLEKIGTKKWAVFYGFGKDSEDDETGYNWYQTYDHRPTLDEIKADIVAEIKAESDFKLRYGYQWGGMTVEYSEALKTDLTGMLVAIQGGIMQFPVEVNLGSKPDGTPQIHSFTSFEELGAVSAGIAAHRAQVSKEEWMAIQALGSMEEYSESQ